MGIQQINASYVADEDRVLLRLSTSADEEYRLWLTRAWLLKFLDVSTEAAVISLAQNHPVAQAQKIAEFQEEAMANKETFAQAFKPAPQTPLGKEPKLVKTITATVEGPTCHMSFRLSNQQTLTLHVDSDLLLKTKLLLKKIAAKAHWLPSSPYGSESDIDSTALQSDLVDRKVFH
jgi:hypothetical protein